MRTRTRCSAASKNPGTHRTSIDRGPERAILLIRPSTVIPGLDGIESQIVRISMMNGLEQSPIWPIVPMRAANKGTSVPAGADGGKGWNQGESDEAKARTGISSSAGRSYVTSGGLGYGKHSTRKPNGRSSLRCCTHITTEALDAAYFSLKNSCRRQAWTGVTWHEYEGRDHGRQQCARKRPCMTICVQQR